MKQNQQRENVGGAMSGGSQAQASKTPLPVKSHRMHLIPPATSCADACIGVCRGSRLSIQGFIGEGHMATFYLAHSKISIPEGKQVSV